MSQPVVRQAIKSDCISLYQLIQEAAGIRKIPTDPKMTPEKLEEDGFVGTPAFYCIVAELEGQLIGYAIYYFTYSTWKGRSACMEDLYVSQMDKRKDVAADIWKKLVQDLLEAGCARCNITVMKENTEMAQFYESHRAVNLTKSESWHFFRMNLDAMKDFVKGCKQIEPVIVRESTPDDCTAIRQQIQELADYENMPEGPMIDAEALIADGFGKRPFYKGYVAEQEGSIVGYMLFFITYNWEGYGVYMEDLYVSPPHRGKGIGMALWRKAIEAGLALQGIRCDFAVLDWNLPSIEFYKSKGASDMTEKSGFLFYRMVEDTMKDFSK